MSQRPVVRYVGPFGYSAVAQRMQMVVRYGERRPGCQDAY